MKKAAFILIFIAFNFVFQPDSIAQQNALSFDGIDDYVALSGATSQLVGGTGISMSCWIYTSHAVSGYPDFDGICGFRNESSADFYMLQLSSTNLEARFRNSSGINYDIVYTGFQLNIWQHFVLTYDGSSLKLYKNGSLVSSVSASGSINSSSETFFVGKLPFQSTSFQCSGKIDDVTLWNKALSLSEIQSLYTCGIPQPTNNLKLHYAFDQGIASGSNSGLTSAVNSAGTGNNATLYNFSLNGSTSNWITGKTIGNFHSISQSVCQGDSVFFNNQYLKNSGVYTQTIPVTGSCDSIIELNLTVNNGFYDTTNRSICFGDSTLFHGNYYSQSGTYNISYSAAQCDSIYTIQLAVLPPLAQFSIAGPQNVIEYRQETYTAPADSSLNYYWFIQGGMVINQPAFNSAQVGWGVPGNGKVQALAINQANCKSDTMTLAVVISVDGIDEFEKQAIYIYPNPARDFLIIQSQEDFEAYIYDANGREIIKSSSAKINVSNLPKGNYSLMLKLKNNKTLSRLLIVE